MSDSNYEIKKLDDQVYFSDDGFETFKTALPLLHECECDFPYEGYGEAITYCEELEDGTLWVGNGEYDSQVNFCPNCGYEAKKKVIAK
jgi:hypothetical protein